MRATLKYFWVVCTLLVLQVGLGVVTAHYGVEGQHLYGIPLADWLPYSVTKDMNMRNSAVSGRSYCSSGLILWLVLVGRSMWPALRKPSESRHLLVLFFLSTVAITIFFAAGLMWDRQTHLSLATYWRWWVVHLWVEGFFEVFATVVIAFLFTRMGLLRIGVATVSVLFATSIFLAGGILGTFHHLYVAGTPMAVLAIGSTFSALEGGSDLLLVLVNQHRTPADGVPQPAALGDAANPSPA